MYMCVYIPVKPLDLVYAVKGHIWPYLPNAAVAPVYAQEGVRGHGAFGVFQIIRCQDSDFGLDTGLKAEFSTAHTGLKAGSRLSTTAMGSSS